jgi:hypothetical protein
MPVNEEQAAVSRARIDDIRRTHEIFNGIKGTKLELRPADYGQTDTRSFVGVPLEIEEASSVLKHEWSHVFFGTDLHAREVFVHDYMERLTSSRPVDAVGLSNFLHLLTNSLDDLRCNSLWFKVYPYSAELIAERWRRILADTRVYVEDLSMFTMGLGLGMAQQMTRSVWSNHTNTLQTAIQMVDESSFPSVLIAARWAVDHILGDVINTMGPQDPSAAQQRRRLGQRTVQRRDPPPVQQPAEDPRNRLLQNMARGSSRTLHLVTARDTFVDSDLPQREPDPNGARTRRTVDAALGVSTQEQVDLLLRMADQEITTTLAELRNRRPRAISSHERMLHGLEGQVSFWDLKPNEVFPFELNPEDNRLAQRLRNTFLRLYGRKKETLDDMGSSIDMTAFLDYRLGNGEPEFYESESVSKGFSALVLLDMSGSMRDHWDIVSRGCKVLARAMKMPFVNLEVWGFSGDEVAHILRFSDPEKGYLPLRGIPIWGLTPAHLAIEVAIRRLRSMSGTTKHLFLLTDGEPQSPGAGTRALMTDVSRKIHLARDTKINVSTLLISTAVPDTDAVLMFGDRRHWKRVSYGEDLFQGMVELCNQSLSRFLRG